jgi:hypothetical protein
MKNTDNILKGQTKVVKHTFSGSNITRFSGLNTISGYMNKQGIIRLISSHFPTRRHNATKFGVNQILLAVVFASLSGINRICHMANFTGDGLVRVLLNLKKAINENTISVTLKKLGQSGARTLQTLLLDNNSRWLDQTGLESITLDADSTVKPVFGSQQGAAKGYNPTKKNGMSYHPLLVFVSEMKLLYHSWFRTGSAYTSNGIVDFLHEVRSSLPGRIKSVFFRADSGFFAGELLDILESWGWNYLIKVKLKNLDSLLYHQNWEPVKGKDDEWVCHFTYKAKGWSKPRTLKAIRTVTKEVELSYLGQSHKVQEYEHACYISSLEYDAHHLHKIYKQRSTSETWIEQVKNHTMAGSTLTDDFWANDILWQLSVFAYNLSVMVRTGKKKFLKQEHRTFANWFILVPARITRSAKQIELKMYEHHFYKEDWEELDRMVKAA